MVLSKNLGYNAKELLLALAIVSGGEGMAVIREDWIKGLVFIGLSVAIVLIRGFYKKYLDGKEEKTPPVTPTA